MTDTVDIPVTPNGNAYLQGNYKPVHQHPEPIELKVVEGKLPAKLRGTLYRLGPNPHYDPLSTTLYHWFDGDGLVHRIHFGDDGTVRYRSRFVHTTKWTLEDKHGRAELGGIRDFATKSKITGLLDLGYSMLDLLDIKLRMTLGITLTDDQIHTAMQGTYCSNTAMLHFNDKLYTLEETGLPMEVHPESLQTIGQSDLDGLIDGQTFTAHPFADPDTGELFTYGYDVVAPYLRYYVLNADGTLKMRRNIDLMFPTMMHTMAFTKTKAIVLQFPATFLAKNTTTDNPIRWEPEYGARIGVFDRTSVDGPVQWFDVPLCYVFHVLNAWDGDDGDTIHLDVARYWRVPLLDMGGDNPSPPLQTNPDARLTRWVIHLNAPTGTPAVTEREWSITPVEFPTCDPRFLMSRNRYGWVTTRPNSGDAAGLFNGVDFYDFDDTSAAGKKSHYFGPTRWVSELLFCPRSAKEADGWLVGLVHDTAASTPDSDRVVVLDTKKIGTDKAVVCELQIPVRVPFQFHGLWVSK